MQRVLAVHYRSFRKTCWSQLHASKIQGWYIVPKRRQGITNTRCIIAQKRAVQLLCGGSLNHAQYKKKFQPPWRTLPVKQNIKIYPNNFRSLQSQSEVSVIQPDVHFTAKQLIQKKKCISMLKYFIAITIHYTEKYNYFYSRREVSQFKFILFQPHISVKRLQYPFLQHNPAASGNSLQKVYCTPWSLCHNMSGLFRDMSFYSKASQLLHHWCHHLHLTATILLHASSTCKFLSVQLQQQLVYE